MITSTFTGKPLATTGRPCANSGRQVQYANVAAMPTAADGVLRCRCLYCGKELRIVTRVQRNTHRTMSFVPVHKG